MIRLLLTLPALALACSSAPAAPAAPGESPRAGNPFRELLRRYDEDRSVLGRFYTAPLSPARHGRMKKFYEEWRTKLEAIPFDSLPAEGRIDAVLFGNHLRHRLRTLDHRRKGDRAVMEIAPFWKTIVDLHERRRRLETIDSAKAAKTLDGLERDVRESREAIEAGLKKEGNGAVKVDKVLARRAARRIDALRRTLKSWHGFYAGYHPEFTWWTGNPYAAADKELKTLIDLLRNRIAGENRKGAEGLVGDPIGREALLDELAYEMIPYTPEELIAKAEEEFAWCETEYRKAARELGFGDEWKKALEHVKNLHVAPGKQPDLIRDLAREAIEFLEKRDLLMIPPLAKEIWRMEMMPPERQKVTPYFTGGETISVSFPTAGMTHERKLMSMRGNNIHFSRATVHHEIIPGHHLQIFMAARHATHRRLFRTPFLVEGWALYWELLLWDLGFPKSPEDRIGMLFWRSHRCARIIVSLKFHLGEMAPKEMVDFLTERVGHELDGATAEVRRYIGGGYGPLYQCAYLVGGFQIRALHKELVDGGKMTNRAFHDAVLRQNAIPVEMIRAAVADRPPEKDFTSTWRFLRKR